MINRTASSTDENKRILRQTKKHCTNMVICIFTTIILVLISQRQNSVQCNGKIGIIFFFSILMYYCFLLLLFSLFYFKKMLPFTGEHPCRSVILIKFISNFIQIVLWPGCSPVGLLHISRAPFFKNTWGLLLNLLLKRLSVREKCPNTELFLVPNFLYSVPVQENTGHK